uniref:hypothetical protein n=1 Tax=Aeromonas enteropelogenes TaxID=29489 RepID=UPI003BA0510E
MKKFLIGLIALALTACGGGADAPGGSNAKPVSPEADKHLVSIQVAPQQQSLLRGVSKDSL